MNDQNLIPNSQRAPSVLREICSKGGKAKAKKMKEAKTMREMVDYIMTQKVEVDGQQLTYLEATTMSAFEEAMKGNINALIFLRDTWGQKPVDNVSVEIEKSEGIEKMQDALIQLAKNGSNTDN